MKDVNEIATDLSRGHRASVELEIAQAGVNGRYEHAVNLSSQRHLRVHPKIAAALGNEDVNKARVAQCCSQHDGSTVRVQPGMQTGNAGGCRQIPKRQERKPAADLLEKQEM